MDLDFTKKGEVKVKIADYTKECIKIFDKFSSLELGTKSIAAASNLFEVDEDSEKLRLFTAWKRKIYLPPREPDPTLVSQYRFSS